MDNLIKQLTDSVKRKFFGTSSRAVDEPNLVRLLDIYAQKYPEAPTPAEIAGVLRERANIPVEIRRLDDRLHSFFKEDRSVWSTQKRLFIPRRGRSSAPTALQVGPLSEILSPTRLFWFPQCTRLPQSQERTRGRETIGVEEAPDSFIVLSEPLFFLSNRLRGYIRLLNVNHDGPVEGHENRLVELAKGEIQNALPKGLSAKAIRILTEWLDLVPARLYLPAGDSYAAIEIRRWFRRAVGRALGYKDVLEISPRMSAEANLIILGSRSSLPLLAEFQETVPNLDITLTDTGIRFLNRDLDDESGPRGFRLARVIVTSWVLETENVHTYIVSNHTRAIEAVVKLLVNDDALGHLADAIVRDGHIPRRFQLAFEVRLERHEGQALVPRLLPQLDGKARIYD